MGLMNLQVVFVFRSGQEYVFSSPPLRRRWCEGMHDECAKTTVVSRIKEKNSGCSCLPIPFSGLLTSPLISLFLFGAESVAFYY